MKRLTNFIEVIDTKKAIEREIKSQGKCNNISFKRYVKLGEYEDLEEQGRLIKLPCKVGDTVYCLCNLHEGVPTYKELRIQGMSINYNNLLVCHVGNWNMISEKDFNKIWFLTKEEAEKALEVQE